VEAPKPSYRTARAWDRGWILSLDVSWVINIASKGHSLISNGLRSYPQNRLQQLLDRRSSTVKQTILSAAAPQNGLQVLLGGGRGFFSIFFRKTC